MFHTDRKNTLYYRLRLPCVLEQDRCYGLKEPDLNVFWELLAWYGIAQHWKCWNASRKVGTSCMQRMWKQSTLVRVASID